MSNTTLTAHSGKPQPFSAFLSGATGQKLISNVLADPKRRLNFVSSIVPAVANNAQIAACTNASIVSCALKGEALGLPHAQELGYYYMVPFKTKEKRDRNGTITQAACTTATFILGYRGLIQLALRSGQYKKLNVTEVYECEQPVWDRFEEELNYKTCTEADRATSKVIGYYATFETVNGFRKSMYMSWDAVMRHACTYSHINRNAWDQYNSGQVSQRDMWQYSSKWYSDFDTMAKKTLIRQLLSKWGIMSVELQQAFTDDQEYQTVTDDELMQISQEQPASETVIDSELAEAPAPAAAAAATDDEEDLDL